MFLWKGRQEDSSKPWQRSSPPTAGKLWPESGLLASPLFHFQIYMWDNVYSKYRSPPCLGRNFISMHFCAFKRAAFYSKSFIYKWLERACVLMSNQWVAPSSLLLLVYNFPVCNVLKELYWPFMNSVHHLEIRLHCEAYSIAAEPAEKANIRGCVLEEISCLRVALGPGCFRITLLDYSEKRAPVLFQPLPKRAGQTEILSWKFACTVIPTVWYFLLVFVVISGQSCCE